MFYIDNTFKVSCGKLTPTCFKAVFFLKMNKKVAVVTGSNRGIGYAIVRGLCKRFEGIVYLTSFDEKLCTEAVAELQKEGLDPSCYVLDITNPKSVAKFRDYIKEKYGGIDLLINNAAIAFPIDATEPVIVQAEKTLFINYFSTLSTCEILFPILRNGARVVNMSSAYGHLSRIPSEKLRTRFLDANLTIPELSNLMREYIEVAKLGTHRAEWGNSSYVVSKVGVTAMTMIHQKLLNGRDIKVNAVHPGYVATEMNPNGHLTIDEGAQAPLYIGLDVPDSFRGHYVWSNKQIVAWNGPSPEELSQTN